MSLAQLKGQFFVRGNLFDKTYKLSSICPIREHPNSHFPFTKWQTETQMGKMGNGKIRKKVEKNSSKKEREK